MRDEKIDDKRSRNKKESPLVDLRDLIEASSRIFYCQVVNKREDEYLLTHFLVVNDRAP